MLLQTRSNYLRSGHRNVSACMIECVLEHISNCIGTAFVQLVDPLDVDRGQAEPLSDGGRGVRDGGHAECSQRGTEGRSGNKVQQK